MAKPENPGQGNGNQGSGEDDESEYAVVVVTEEAEHRYEGTSYMHITADGSLLVGKTPLAAFSATTWLRAFVVEPVPEP